MIFYCRLPDSWSISQTQAHKMCLAIYQRTLQKQCLHMTNTGRSKAVYPHHSCMCIVIIIKDDETIEWLLNTCPGIQCGQAVD